MRTAYRSRMINPTLLGGPHLLGVHGIAQRDKIAVEFLAKLFDGGGWNWDENRQGTRRVDLAYSRERPPGGEYGRPAQPEADAFGGHDQLAATQEVDEQDRHQHNWSDEQKDPQGNVSHWQRSRPVVFRQ